MIRVTILSIIAGLMLLGSCTNRDERLFTAIYSSDLGLGIMLDQHIRVVQSKLGEPAVKVETKGGRGMEDYYLTPDISIPEHLRPDPEVPGRKDPQLNMTYLDDKLVRIYNCYRPDDPKIPNPPFFCEILPGVKLGSRKSQFHDALGAPTREIQGQEWQFVTKEGRRIAVLAEFTELPDIKQTLCTSLQVTLSNVVAEQQGEQFEENANWREKVGIE